MPGAAGRVQDGGLRDDGEGTGQRRAALGIDDAAPDGAGAAAGRGTAVGPGVRAGRERGQRDEQTEGKGGS